MGHRRLRAFFQKLVASGGLITGAGRLVNGCCPPAPEPIVAERAIDPSNPMWGALVAMCRANDDVCTQLCTKLVFGGALPDDTSITECFMQDRSDREVLVHTEYIVFEECIGGRRPPGLVAPVARAASPVGAWLAEVAHLEAASVPAFVLLARDLVALDAPAALVQAALRAADDEIVHARMLTALARGHGAEPADVVLHATPLRDRHALALDNVVEGCVREAFAALCAHHQAIAALDPALRTAFARIAVDETRHAALALAVHAWLAPQLAPAARTQIARARHAAFDELIAAPSVSADVATAIGWPSADRARALMVAARPVLAG